MRTLIGLLATLALTSCHAPEADRNVDEGTEATATGFIDPLSLQAPYWTVEFENDSVRVVRERVPAGEEVPMHSHKEMVAVNLKDAGIVVWGSDGERIEANLEAGTVGWRQPTTHAGIAKDDLEQIHITLKAIGGEPIVVPELDATTVDSEHHVVEFENEKVRIVRMTYPAGSTSPVHEHSPGLTVALTDFHSRNIPAGGQPEESSGKAGAVVWSDGGPPHATQNLGETDIVVVRVEMKHRSTAELG